MPKRLVIEAVFDEEGRCQSARVLDNFPPLPGPDPMEPAWCPPVFVRGKQGDDIEVKRASDDDADQGG